MNCPNPKCKGGKRISTKRTFDEGTQIRREKFCPKCKTKFMTIEFTEQAYSSKIKDLDKKISDLASESRERQYKYNDLTSHLKEIITAAGFQESKKKSNGKADKKTVSNECKDCGEELFEKEEKESGYCWTCNPN
jgi:transcriptional regulator NrdR family protein